MDRIEAVLDSWRETEGPGFLTISGTSMRPLLPNGCRVVVRPAAGLLRLGDIIVYRRGEMVFVHRIVRVLRRDGSPRFVAKGDGAFGFDPAPVAEDRVVGKVIGFERNGAVVDIESAWWRAGGLITAVLSYIVGVTARAARPVTGRLRRREGSKRGRDARDDKGCEES